MSKPSLILDAIIYIDQAEAIYKSAYAERVAAHENEDAKNANDEDAWPNAADRILALAWQRIEAIEWTQFAGRPRLLLGDVEAALR